MPNNFEMRNLESWHDEHEGQMDESCYQELVDSGNTNGWSADEMFKYNERRHKILSSYCEKTTFSGKYTTPVPKVKSKTTMRMASKLAKEIEDKVNAAGRVTPESSDDDELFERERTRRIQMKQVKQLDQLINNHKNINHSQNRHSSNHGNSTTISNNNHFGPVNASNYNSVASGRKSNRSSSQHSNSSATPATASLSSSPTLNDSNLIMKPVTSSSRNILRTSLI